MKNQRSKARLLLIIIVLQTFFTPLAQSGTGPIRLHVPAGIYTSDSVANAPVSAGVFGNLEPYLNNKAIFKAPGVVNDPGFQDLEYADPTVDGGPSAPEVQTFTAAGTENMVDLFSGDLTYNIPLLDVGGYPLNLSYHSGISPTDEASWVGLGWNLNPGAVNRDVRGLPDDCKGDPVQRQMNLKPNETTTVSGSFSIQGFGVDLPIGLNFNTGVSYNNYRGWGLTSGVGVSLEASSESGNAKVSGSLGLGVGIDSRNGGYLDANAGMDAQAGKMGANIGAGLRINAMEGLESINFEYGAKYSTLKSGTSGAFPFASPSYVPKIDMPMRTRNILFRGTLGGEVNGIHMNGSIAGSNAQQQLASKNHSVMGYGYLYAQFARHEDQLDLNREKDGPYQKEIPNLPLTAFTYDLYAVSAQGINEQFRPFRSDIGTLHDPQMQSTGSGTSAGAEVGLGNLVHIGLDLTFQNTRSLSQKWTADNAMAPNFIFADSIPGSPLYEPVYFKSLSEITASGDETSFNLLGQDAAVAVALHDPNDVSFGQASNRLTNNRTVTTPAATMLRQRTPRRNQMSWRTAAEVAQRGPEWHTFTIFHKKNSSTPDLERVFAHRKADHIGEIEVINDGGSRFQYSLPAYNTLLKKVSFNIGAHSPTENGQVAYTPGATGDNSVNNAKGQNHYFNAEYTPPHAYAWLLTSVFSPDYQDLSNNGPSADDLGNYTKFSYELAHGNYKWRNPVQQNMASLDERFSSDANDDQAHYTYGEKEIWYLAQVESRNYIAILETSDREDAKGVMNENGGINERQKLRKLDKITLYTMQEYDDARFAIPARVPVPLKTVHFEYDYSLCANAPGSPAGQGKLTLKKLWFTYQQSAKEALSPYLFNYAENPGYSARSANRWGYYKPNVPGPMNNDRFPYVRQQDRATQDRNAAAWNLSDIAMPTGGLLHIDYESDDYAYVQDKAAMVMCEVTGFSNTATGAISNNMITSGVGNANYLHFRLPQGVTHGNRAQLYAAIQGLRNLYFNINVTLKPGDAQPEAVTGFVPIENILPASTDRFGFDAVGAGTAWIRLPELNPDTRHAIAKAGFELIRKSLPERLDNESYNDHDFIAAVGNFAQKFGQIFSGGIEHYLYTQGFCRQMQPGSFIRLNQVSGSKLGGGARVKRITLNDRWGNMQRNGYDEGLDFEYGQEYIYTVNDPVAGREISSGVAAYEPLVGNDENPLVQPVSYRIVQPLSVDLNLYQLEPFGESFFPAPQVGYSRVVVRNLHHADSIRSASGFSVSEYYTAKDFPVITRQTALQSLFRDVWVPVLNLYNLRVNAATVSQGFVVEINDMHGKPKSTRVFNQANVAITGADYQYYDYRGANYVPTLNGENDAIAYRNLGVFWDVALDARQYINTTDDFGAGINLEIAMQGPAPIPIPVVLPNIAQGKSEYRGITLTKVLRKNGILREVRAFDNGASVTTKNLLWDSNTGQVIVTETENEFGNFNYQVTLPAYWAYPAMGMAAKNADLRLQNQNVGAGGSLPLPNAAQMFTGGEELWLYPVATRSVAGGSVSSPALPLKAWVYRAEASRLILVDAAGQNTPAGRYHLKVMRSGYRNMTGAGLGGFTTQSNPIQENRLRLNSEQVLNAAAQTYSDFWQSDVIFSQKEPLRDCECAPASANTKQPLGSLLSYLNTLMSNAAARSVVTPVNVGNSTYQIAANSGSFISGEVRFQGETPCTFSVSATSGLSFDAFAGQNCTLNWSALQFDLLESGCQSPDGFFVPCAQNPTQGIRVYAPCLELLQCRERPASSVMPAVCGAGGIINPFFNNILGNWRPLASYRHIAGRTNTGHTASSGYFSTPMSFFWQWNTAAGRGLVQTSRTENWQRADSAAVFNTFGKPLEVFDALNRPSGIFYGNGHTLDLATATNAHYTDIGYEGFEEYYYYARRYYRQPGVCQLDGHLRLNFDMDFADHEAQLTLRSFIVSDRAHSGKHSLKSTPARPFYVRRKVWRDSPDFVRGQRSERVTGNTFTSRRADQIQPFAPRAGRYVLSVWVHEPGVETKSTFTNAQVTINLTGRTPLRFQATGPMIEGWQQIYAEFDLSEASTDIEIVLSSLLGDVYFDDLRIQPIHSAMQTYAYDDITLRLIATHDAQNFTAFYEYDSEGYLARKKRETERGIVTLQEIRTAKPKSER